MNLKVHTDYSLRVLLYLAHEDGQASVDEIALLSQFVRPADIILEVGANIGTHTVPFARMGRARGGRCV